MNNQHLGHFIKGDINLSVAFTSWSFNINDGGIFIPGIGILTQLNVATIKNEINEHSEEYRSAILI